jgi:hypothetical protein
MDAIANYPGEVDIAVADPLAFNAAFVSARVLTIASATPVRGEREAPASPEQQMTVDQVADVCGVAVGEIEPSSAKPNGSSICALAGRGGH